MNTPRSRNGGSEFTDEDFRGLQYVLQSGTASHGPEIAALESEFCELTGHKYALTFNSWTSAAYSYLRYKFEEVGPGDVVIPSFTFSATGNVILNSGFRVQFADINPRTFAISPESVLAKISPQTRGIMVVHYAGIYDHENTEALRNLALSKNLFFLEDCAESVGAAGPNSEPSGSLGDSFFSFYATKGISSGEGGVVCLEDEKAYEWLSSFRGHGVKRDSALPWRRNAMFPGQNFRLANLNAALALTQLAQMPGFINRRRAIASEYRDLLESIPGVTLPDVTLDGTSWQMFPVIVDQKSRDNVVFKLLRAGIGASVHFDPPLHEQRAFLSSSRGSLHFTEEISSRVITLPIHTLLNPTDVREIALTLEEAVRSTGPS